MNRPGPGRVAGILFAVTATALTGLLSAVPWRPAGADRALLRLSWRATGSLVEECRRPTDEENARLPAHMRREEICEGRTAPFHLLVAVDGQRVVEDTVRAAGARGDRPMYVFRELDLVPGDHDVSIDFRTLLPDSEAAIPENSFPTHLRLDTSVTLETGTIILITYDTEARQLVARSR